MLTPHLCLLLQKPKKFQFQSLQRQKLGPWKMSAQETVRMSQQRIISHASSIKAGVIAKRNGLSMMVSVQRLVADANKSKIIFFDILPM
jgi:hypothetical protein